jgi:glycosyltransferase involved in cell wall biosynthesis
VAAQTCVNECTNEIGVPTRIVMLLQNDSYPDDTRVRLEAQTLRDAGHEITVICPTGASLRCYEQIAGVRVFRYPKPWEASGSLGYVWEYAYSLSVTFMLTMYVAVRYGFDVVHTRTPPDMYVLIGVFYKFFGKKYVVDVNDPSPDLYLAQHDGAGNGLVLAILYWFERMTCRTADCFITVSESVRRMQIERSGAPPDRFHVVRNVPSERFLESVEPLNALREDGQLIIGYMGLIGHQDRVDVMLRALHHLKHDEGRSDFRAVIVGSGPGLGDLKRLALELELQQHVRFAGYRVGDDLLRHVASFDICVVPDPSNPYNHCCAMLKMMEYMAMAKPVVAFDLQENRITAGDAAIFVADNDEQQFAAQLNRLMDDHELRQQLGQRGRDRVNEYLAWDYQKQYLLEAYDQILTKPRGSNVSDHPATPSKCDTGAPTDEKQRVLV